MKLDDIQSKELLPRFAHNAEWIQLAFDVMVKRANARAKSIDAPLTLEAIHALTDEELEAYYNQFGIAQYYPDLSRETRDKMLFELCKYYRFLGTPKAIEILCNYILNGIPLDVEVYDNLAFDEHGNLIDQSLLDVFDIKVGPHVPLLSADANERILANVNRFSRNSQTLRFIYYDFESGTDVNIFVGLDPDNPQVVVEYPDNGMCEPVIVKIPMGGTISATSDNVIYTQNACGLLVPGGYAYSDGELLDMQWDFGGTVEEYNATIDLTLAVRYDPSTSQWLSKTFWGNYWWWSGIISSQEESDILAFGLDVCETTDQSSANAGPIGALKYDPSFDYELEKFYSDMGETEVPFDKNNFYLGSCDGGYTENSQYLGCLVIHSIVRYETYIKTYGIVAKPGGNRNNIMYTSNDMSVVTITNTWTPLYRRDGETVKYTGSLPLIIGYFSTTSTYNLTMNNLNEWSVRNNDGVLEVSCSGNRSANRIVVQWGEDAKYAELSLILAVRCDTSTHQWLSKTFPSDNYWWWAGVISSQEESDIYNFSLDICPTVASGRDSAGPIGALKFDPSYDYSLEKFYSDMGETEVPFDKNNFYLGAFENGYSTFTDYDGSLLIHNVLAFNASIKTYGIVAKPGGNRNNIMYTAQDRSVVTVSSTWLPLYRRDGVAIKYTGNLPTIIGYFTTASTYALTTTNLSEWSFRNNNGILEVSCSGNRSANRVVVQWYEDPSAIVLDLGLRWSDDSGSSSGYWRSVQLNDWWYGGLLTQADKDKAEAFGLETGSFGKAGPLGSFLMDYGCVYTILAIYTDIVDGKGSGTITFDPANFYCSSGNKFGLQNWIIFDYVSAISSSAKAFRVQIKRVYPTPEKKTAYVSPDKTVVSVSGNNSKYLYDENGNYIPYDSTKNYYEYSYTNNSYDPPYYQTGGGFIIVQKGQYLGVTYYNYGFSLALSSLEYVEVPNS